MKFSYILLCTLFLAAKASASDVNASTCNACSESQKQQRAISARQENHLSQQYVLDLVSGALNKYTVYLDSTCRPSKAPAKGPTINAVGGCGSFWAADEEVVEPELLEKGRAMSTVFLYYGTAQAKLDINVADLASSNANLAGMDAFDYTNTSSYRNSLNERLIAAIKDQALSDLNPTLAGAIANLLKPLDRVFADGKIFVLDVTFKFSDDSEVTIKVEGEHNFTVTETAQDANNNNVAQTANDANGQTYAFEMAPTDYADWLNYMRQLGVRISDGSNSGARGMSCSSTITGDGTTVVSCHPN